MDFVFTHDGGTFRLHTETGEVQCDPIDTAPPPPLEPSGDSDD